MYSNFEIYLYMNGTVHEDDNNSQRRIICVSWRSCFHFIFFQFGLDYVPLRLLPDVRVCHSRVMQSVTHQWLKILKPTDFTSKIIELFQEKIHTPLTDGFLKVLLGGGCSEAMEILAGGGIEPKKVFFGDHFQPNVILNLEMWDMWHLSTL